MLSFPNCRRQASVISRNAFRSGGLLVCTALLAIASLCTRAQSPTTSRAPKSGGLVVLEVTKNSEASKAGIRVGDTITRWAQAGREGSIASPLDLVWLERERGPRGSLALGGSRASDSTRWTLSFTPWGIAAGPNSINAPTIDARIKAFASRNEFDKLAEFCRAACDRITQRSSLRCWPFLNAARVLAASEHWKAADEFYTKAIDESRRTPTNLSGQIYEEWGEVYERHTDWARARTRYGNALVDDRRFDPESLTVAYDLQKLALIQFRLGDVPEAERLAGQALQIRRKLCPNTPEMVKILNYMGVFAQENGDLDSADSYLRQGLELAQRVEPNGRDTAHAYNNLGAVAEKRGDLARAEQYYLRDIEISTHLDPNDYLLSYSWGNLGTIAYLRGNLARAKEYYLKTLAIQEKHGSATDVAMTLQNLASVLKDKGELSDAEKLLRRAATLQANAAPHSIEFGQTLDTLGTVLRMEGKLQQAEQSLSDSLDLLERVSPNSLEFADSLYDLGEVYREEDNLQKAEKQYASAAEIRKMLAPGKASYAECLAALGDLARLQNRRDVAIADYEKAIDVLDSQSAQLGGANESRLDFHSKYASYYRQYISLLMQQRTTEQAFEVLERSRARTLLQMLARGHVSLRTGISPELLKQENRVYQELAKLSDRRVRILLSKHTPSEVADVERARAGLMAQDERLKAQIRADSPHYAALTQPRPLTVREMQQLLDRKTLLLEYSLEPEHSYLFALTRSSLTAFELPPAQIIETLATHLYDSMTHGPSHSTEISEREKRLLSHASEELSRVILAPVGNLMKSYARIAVIPEGALQYIPFAALPVPGEFGPNSYVPLIATHDVVNLPSVSILAMLRQGVHSRKRIYARTASVVADPVFSADDARVLAGPGRRSATTRSDVDSSRDNLTRSIQDTTQDAENKEIRLPRLLYSRLEAQAVASVVPKGQTYEALDFDASRATVTSSSFGKSRIIHFATHGFFDSKKPELSGLIFSMVDRTGEPEVGFYGLEDVFNASPTADLVVLSGCQTALGQEVDGEGLVGLAWGFLYAGANSVVASLWNVDDASTAELMRLFYEGMETNGLSPAKALRQAQLAISSRARWAFPYYWAPFIIEGDWTTAKTN